MNIENKNTIFNLLGPVILNGINFFTIPLFTRILGPAQYGIVSVYSTWVGVFAIIMGLQVQGSIGPAKVRLNDSELKQYFCSIMILGLFFSLVCLIIGALAYPLLEMVFLLPPLGIISLGMQSVGMFVIGFSSMAFTFLKKADRSFSVNVTTAICTTGLSLIFLYTWTKPDELFLARITGQAIPVSIIAGVMIYYFLKTGGFSLKKEYICFCLPICLPLVFHGISHIVLAQSDRVMLQHMMDNEATGIYSFMIIFSGVLATIWSALNNTWVPFYYDDLKANALQRINEKTKNYIFIFSIISIVFILWAPEVIHVFVPQPYWVAIKLLPLFVLSNYFVFMYSFPVNFEFYHKKTYSIACGTVCAAGLNILLNYIFIPIWGLFGAALATLLAHILLFLFHEIIAACFLPFKYHYRWSTFAPGITCVGLCVLISTCLIDYSIIRWCIGAILTFVFFRHIYIRKSIF